MRWLTVCGVLMACVASSASADEVASAEEQAFFAALDPLITPLEATESCDEVAVIVNDWITLHGVELKTASEELEVVFATLSPERETLFIERFSTRAEVLFGASLRCAEHEAAVKAFDAMDAILLGEDEVEETVPSE